MKLEIKQFTMYGALFVLVVALGIGFERYTNNKIQVEMIAIDDTEGDPLYSERSEAAELIDDKININTASSELLQSIEGIGPSTAKKIIEYRERNGVYHVTEDIMNVAGIGIKTYNSIKDQICAQ